MAASLQSHSSTAEDEAIEFLCRINIHCSLWLPATQSHGKLRVTYGVTSNFDDSNLPVILFLGPMLATRWHVVEVDKIAKENGVRVICIDMPAMGGSTPVPLQQRVQVWLETVPVLLKELHVEYISLVAHSAGIVYLLNTLWHYRTILDPKAPYAAVVAPWVHNSHSRAPLMNLISSFPNGALDLEDKLQHLAITKINPALYWSRDILAYVGNALHVRSRDPECDGASGMEKYGVRLSVARHIAALYPKWMLAEKTSAASHKAAFCLKKGSAGNWGVCEDYGEYVRSFCKRETERRAENAQLAKLRVRAFFAQSDTIIGKGGQKYFNECWTQSCVPDVVDFSSVELAGTNHATVLMDIRKGAMGAIFDDVGRKVGLA